MFEFSPENDIEKQNEAMSSTGWPTKLNFFGDGCGDLYKL